MQRALRTLSVLFLLVVRPVQAQFTWVTNDNTITITGYNGSGGIVTIPPLIAGLPVNTIGSKAFGTGNIAYPSTQPKGVILSTNITSIEDGAFQFCKGLQSINFPDALTNIGTYAFLGSGLLNIALSSNVANIGSSAFGYCYDLTNVTICNGVRSIGPSAFYECVGLTNVAIPESVTSLGAQAFRDCWNLSSVALRSGVISIGDSAFAYTIISNIVIPSSVISIGDSAFADTRITNITIPSNVISIGASAFAYTPLTSAIIASGVTSIGEYAFGSSSLSSVSIPASVTNIGIAPFSGCANLTAITVNQQNSFYGSMDGVLFDKNQTTVIEYPMGRAGNYAIPTWVTVIANDAFANAVITSVTIPIGMTSIGSSAFVSCSGLTSVTIPGSVTSIGDNAFAGSGVTNVTIPGRVAAIGGSVFANCEGLRTVTISNGVTSIPGFTFIDCLELTSVTLPSSVTNIGVEAFEECVSLTNVFFEGNAPSVENSFISDIGATAYYLAGTTGWDDFSTNSDLPTVLWNPLIETGNPSFGVRINQFGFQVIGTTNIPIVVEYCTNLVSPRWTPLQTLNLTKGSFYFSEPIQTSNSARYYRVSPP